MSRLAIGRPTLVLLLALFGGSARATSQPPRTYLLSAAVPSGLTAVQSSRTPWTVQYRVTVETLRFDGPLGGPAVLHACWRLLDGAGRELVRRGVNRSEAATEASHAALVAAQSRLLAGISRDIGAEIQARQR
jgi:uncharacterized lipoprotein YmbA